MKRLQQITLFLIIILIINSLGLIYLSLQKSTLGEQLSFNNEIPDQISIVYIGYKPYLYFYDISSGSGGASATYGLFSLEKRDVFAISYSGKYSGMIKDMDTIPMNDKDMSNNLQSRPELKKYLEERILLDQQEDKLILK